MRGFAAVLVATAALLGAPARAADAETELLKSADRHFRVGNYQLALEAYQKFTRSYPLSERAGDAMLKAGISQVRLGRYGEAIETLETVKLRYGRGPGFDSVFYWIGMSRYQLGDYQQAEEALTEYLSSAPGAPLRGRARLTLALVLLEAGDEEGARELLERFVEEDWYDGQYEAGKVRLAALYLSAAQPEKALELTTKETQYKPEWRPWVRLYRAEALWQIGRLEEAEPLYRGLQGAEPAVARQAYRRLFALAELRGSFAEMERLVQSAERDLAGSEAVLRELLIRVGIESYKRGSIDLAEYFLKRVWDARPPLPEQAVVLYLAEIRLVREQQEQAAAILQDYIGLDPPERADALMRLADIRLTQNRFADAAEIYERFLRELPDSPRAREAATLLVYCQYRLGHWQSAIDSSRALQSADSLAPFEQDLRRIEALALARAGRAEEAGRRLEQYTATYPEDVQAELDLLKTKHALGDYPGVVEAASGLLSDNPDLSRDDPRSYLLVRYLAGLARIGTRDYEGAFADLQAVSAGDPASVGLAVVEPYALYYRGWALYRMARLAEAREVLFELIDRYGEHPLRSQAVYLAGWILYRMEDYRGAIPFFQEASEGDGAQADQASFLQAKSLVALGRDAEARALFTRIAQGPSPLADDALYESALLMAEEGRIDDAARAYLAVADRFPDSPLSEQAVYQRAFLLQEAGRSSQAAEAFAEYRRRYPEGEQISGALYWGGVALSDDGQLFGAVLLWELLVDRHRESPFVADAQMRMARAYADRGDTRRAIALAEIVAREHPSYTAQARALAEELRLRQAGLSQQEAALRSQITRSRGVATPEGRRAMLELARLLSYDAASEPVESLRLIEELVRAGSPDTLADALFLRGEIEQRRGRPVQAAETFVSAAVAARGNDLAAAALFRAAEASVQAGLDADARELVRRLEREFADSPWTAAGRTLVGGSR
jgi:TolA-binding protein